MGITAANLAGLAAELSGVELGAFDRQIIEWLTQWEPSTVAVVCGLIGQAREAATGADARMVAEVRAVLAAFDWEHDDRQLALEAIERIADGGQP